jgi:transcriptional regulator with XRE-family HTH domain
VKDKAFMKAFGEHLRSLRQERGLTLENLEELTEIHYNQIGRIERGEINPTICTLLVLSKALKVHHKDLLNFEYKPGKN